MKKKEVAILREYKNGDEISRQIEAYRRYPILCLRIDKKQKKYDLIIVDPPYKHPQTTFWHSTCPYKLLDFEDVIYLPIKELRSEGSIILLWAIDTVLFKALWLLNAWGYRFINIVVVWRKLNKDGKTFGR